MLYYDSKMQVQKRSGKIIRVLDCTPGRGWVHHDLKWGAESELGTTQRFRPLNFQLLTPLLSLFVPLKGTLVLSAFFF